FSPERSRGWELHDRCCRAAPLCPVSPPPRMLGLALGVLTAASSIGLAAGPAIGGFLTHLLSWHWIFLINIPIGIVGIIYAHMVIPPWIIRQRRRRHLI
ncbi:MFS transporter, partial [Methanogenium cariaci]|uniref:MFS transporter n=1 Tax=Methanogenium cariaci TaxID=2197 RepID=UPI0012F66ADA